MARASVEMVCMKKERKHQLHFRIAISYEESTNLADEIVQGCIEGVAGGANLWKATKKIKTTIST